jgi:hypothetical protein
MSSNNQITRVKFSSIQVGDKVETKYGDWVTVRQVTKGIYKNSTMIVFDGEHWACQPNTATINVKRTVIHESE